MFETKLLDGGALVAFNVDLPRHGVVPMHPRHDHPIMVLREEVARNVRAESSFVDGFRYTSVPAGQEMGFYEILDRVLGCGRSGGWRSTLEVEAGLVAVRRAGVWLIAAPNVGTVAHARVGTSMWHLREDVVNADLPDPGALESGPIRGYAMIHRVPEALASLVTAPLIF